MRINPGNIGSIERIKEVIKAAKDYNCVIRIGVNGGSLEKKILEKYGEPNPDALVESAINNIKICGTENPSFGNYLGVVQDDELNKLYNSSKFVLLPSPLKATHNPGGTVNL